MIDGWISVKVGLLYGIDGALPMLIEPVDGKAWKAHITFISMAQL